MSSYLHPARRWLSQQEAADYLGVTDRTIRNWIARGAIRGHRVRGSRLIRLDRLELDAELMRPIPNATDVFRPTSGGDNNA